MASVWIDSNEAGWCAAPLGSGGRVGIRWTGPSLRESGKPCPTAPSLPKGEIDLGDAGSVSEQGGLTPR